MGCSYDADYEPNARTQRIFARGHLGEDMMAGWLREAGYELKTEKKDGRQFGFSVADGRFAGHCDGIITAGPGIDQPTIWEHKCLGQKSWKTVEAKGVKTAKPEYYAQMQIYMAYLSCQVALFTALNMDTMEIYVELVDFDRKAAQDASDKAVAIIQDTEAGHLRAKVSDDPDYWMCSNRTGKCEFWGRCHAGPS